MTKRNRGFTINLGSGVNEQMPGFMETMFPAEVEEAQAGQSLGEAIHDPATDAADVDMALRAMFVRHGRVSDRLAANVAAHPIRGGAANG